MKTTRLITTVAFVLSILLFGCAPTGDDGRMLDAGTPDTMPTLPELEAETFPVTWTAHFPPSPTLQIACLGETAEDDTIVQVETSFGRSERVDEFPAIDDCLDGVMWAGIGTFEHGGPGWLAASQYMFNSELDAESNPEIELHDEWLEVVPCTTAEQHGFSNHFGSAFARPGDDAARSDDVCLIGGGAKLSAN